MACAPPALNTPSTPAMPAATSLTGGTEPSGSTGLARYTSSTPAMRAGMAHMSTVLGRGAALPGT